MKISFTNAVQLHPDIVYIFLLSFADENLSISSSTGGLQKQIQELENYCEQWKLTVNMELTEEIEFTNGGKLSRHEKWFCKGCTLETITSYNYVAFILLVIIYGHRMQNLQQFKHKRYY